MNRAALLGEIVNEFKHFPWYPDSPSEEDTLDLYCEAGCAFYYSDDEKDEDTAYDIFAKARWPDGVLCPRCGNNKISSLLSYRKYECLNCEYQFSATSKTVFHKLRIPMRHLVGLVALLEAHQWKRGVRHFLSSANPDPDMTANPISYPTVWRLTRLAQAPEWLVH